MKVQLLDESWSGGVRPELGDRSPCEGPGVSFEGPD